MFDSYMKQVNKAAKVCKHDETIDVGDEEHIVVACTQCQKILKPAILKPILHPMPF